MALGPFEAVTEQGPAIIHFFKFKNGQASLKKSSIGINIAYNSH